MRTLLVGLLLACSACAQSGPQGTWSAPVEYQDARTGGQAQDEFVMTLADGEADHSLIGTVVVSGVTMDAAGSWTPSPDGGISVAVDFVAPGIDGGPFDGVSGTCHLFGDAEGDSMPAKFTGPQISGQLTLTRKR